MFEQTNGWNFNKYFHPPPPSFSQKVGNLVTSHSSVELLRLHVTVLNIVVLNIAELTLCFSERKREQSPVQVTGTVVSREEATPL